MSAKDFYRTMWNPLYEGTDHKQFSYNELIEFAEEYATRKLVTDEDLANVMLSLCCKAPVDSDSQNSQYCTNCLDECESYSA